MSRVGREADAARAYAIDAVAFSMSCESVADMGAPCALTCDLQRRTAASNGRECEEEIDPCFPRTRACGGSGDRVA